MKLTVMGIKVKNLLFVLAFIVSILIMSNYFQQIMEAYIKNSILRWGIGIVLSFVMLHILYNNPIFKVDSNHKELMVSEENVIKQNELDLLDEQNDKFRSTSNSVFRVHFQSKEPSYVDGWLVIDENMKDQTGRDMVGYVPVDTTTGAPSFISSYSVDSYDYLYEKPKPQITILKVFSAEELVGSLISQENEQDSTQILNKESGDNQSINQPNYKYIRGRQIRFFTLEEFDGNLAHGYIKLIKSEKGLGIHVIDTYNSESKEEAENYINSGFIKVGYQSKFDFD